MTWQQGMTHITWDGWPWDQQVRRILDCGKMSSRSCVLELGKVHKELNMVHQTGQAWSPHYNKCPTGDKLQAWDARSQRCPKESIKASSNNWTPKQRANKWHNNRGTLITPTHQAGWGITSPCLSIGLSCVHRFVWVQVVSRASGILGMMTAWKFELQKFCCTLVIASDDISIRLFARQEPETRQLEPQRN